MAGRLLPIALAAGLFVAGCGQSGNGRVQMIPDPSPPQGSTAAIERLASEKLPSLEAVETWDSDFGPGLKLTTRHYEIFTTVLEPLMLRRIPGFIESAYRGYNSQLPKRVETKRKFTVYLFADRGQWEAFTNDFAGSTGDRNVFVDWIEIDGVHYEIEEMPYDVQHESVLVSPDTVDFHMGATICFPTEIGQRPSG